MLLTKIVLEKLENAVARAEEYRLFGKGHPEGFKVHIEYIEDLMKSAVMCQQQACDRKENYELFDDVLITLANLQNEVARAERGLKRSTIDELLGLGELLAMTFDGDTDKCYDFMDRFMILVHDNPSFRTVYKMIILKRCLKGKAFDLVSALPTSAGNYKFAWELLRKVYVCFPQCLSQLYQRLNELPRVSMNDGVNFRHTYKELENILQSMKSNNVNVDNDLHLRFLYLQKFSEDTLLAPLVKDSDMSLPDIREEIRRVVYLQVLKFLSNQSKQSSDEPSVSENNTNGVASGSQIKDPKSIRNKNKTSTAEQNGSNGFAEAEPSKSNSQSSANADEYEFHIAPALTTVCATVSYHTNGRKTSTTVRLILQNIAPVSLLSESAAKRLGIQIPKERNLPLVGTLGNRFKATQKAFKLLLHVGNGIPNELIKVHIFNANDEPPGAVDIAEFKKAHPHLAHMEFPDTGKDRPVDLFLSGAYWSKFVVAFWKPPSECPPVKDNYKLTPTAFGWIVGGEVKYKNLCVLSYLLEEERPQFSGIFAYDEFY